MARPRRPWRNVDISFVECRTLGHAWDRIPGDVDWQPRGRSYLDGNRVTFRCLRCPTLKRELWGIATGEMLTRAYEYPEGYQTDGLERDAALATYGTLRQSFRLEYAKRTLNGNSPH